MEAYLDNSATTRAYPEVGDLVYKVMCQDYGNPSSMHRKGVDAEHYVKEAKETIAKVLKVNAKDIYFTSGGTESDNLALIGCARANRRAGNHLITTSIEHPAILNTMRYLEEEEGFRVTYLPVDASGRVNLEALKEAGIPVINLDTQVKNSDLTAAFIGSDNKNAGYVCGKHLKEKCPDGGKILIFENKGINSVNERITGFEQAISPILVWHSGRVNAPAVP